MEKCSENWNIACWKKKKSVIQLDLAFQVLFLYLALLVLVVALPRVSKSQDEGFAGKACIIHLSCQTLTVR